MSRTGVSEVDDRFESTSWILSAYEDSSPWAYRYSRRHLLDPETGSTLCGAKPGAHEVASDSGRCRNCYRIGGKR